MTPEQIGLDQAVLDGLVVNTAEGGDSPKQGAILAAITALKQICNHPANYQDDGRPLAGRSGKLTRLEEIVESVFASGERSEEHTSELQSLMRTSYAVFCLKHKKQHNPSYQLIHSTF